MDHSFKIDFIGIGASKAGTTWLARVLDAHPDICLSAIKETNFFCKEHVPTIGAYIQYDGTNMDRYPLFFKKCRPGQIKGEYSVHYMRESMAARNIHKNFPDIKIIAVLREPVSRFFSHYRFNRAILKKEAHLLEHLIHPDEALIQHGMYARNLRPYFDLFPKDNIKVLIYEEMSADPYGALKELYSFLGVDDSFVPHELMERRINPTVQVRFRSIIKILDRVRFALIMLGIERLICATFKKKLYYFVQKINFKKMNHEEIDEDVRRKIKDLYVEDRKKLEALLKRNLSEVW